MLCSRLLSYIRMFLNAGTVRMPFSMPFLNIFLIVDGSRDNLFATRWTWSNVSISFPFILLHLASGKIDAYFKIKMALHLLFAAPLCPFLNANLRAPYTCSGALFYSCWPRLSSSCSSSAISRQLRVCFCVGVNNQPAKISFSFLKKFFILFLLN